MIIHPWMLYIYFNPCLPEESSFCISSQIADHKMGPTPNLARFWNLTGFPVRRFFCSLKLMAYKVPSSSDVFSKLRFAKVCQRRPGQFLKHIFDWFMKSYLCSVSTTIFLQPLLINKPHQKSPRATWIPSHEFAEDDTNSVSEISSRRDLKELMRYSLDCYRYQRREIQRAPKHFQNLFFDLFLANRLSVQSKIKKLFDHKPSHAKNTRAHNTKF